VHREAELACDGLGEEHVAVGPRPRLGAVQRQHADHPVEHDHGGREHRAGAEALEHLDATERRVDELGSVLDVGDGDRAAVACGEVRDRQRRRGAGDRLKPFDEPLGAHGHRLVGLAEADEAARGAERASRFRHRDARDRVEVMTGADAARDLRDETLASECMVERGGGARPVERDRRLTGQCLDQPQFLHRKHPPFVRGGRDHDTDHALVDDQRYERRALGAHAFREALVDQRRRIAVEDRHGRSLEEGARDPGRLVVEVHAHLAPPREVLPAGACEQPGRLVLVSGDERERVELGADEHLDLVQQQARRLGRILDPRERVHQPGDGVDLPVAHGDELLGLAGARAAHQDHRGLAPATEEDDRRDERDERRRERGPDMPSDRRFVVQHDRAEDRRRDRDRREDRGQRDVRHRHAAPLAPERRRERGGHEQVGARQHEQRHRVEIDSLVCVAHWAIR